MSDCFVWRSSALPRHKQFQGRRSRSGRSSGRWINIRPTNPCKNAVWTLVNCSIVALKVAMLEGTADDSCHPQDFCWSWRKAHFCHLKKVSVKAQVLGNYAYNRSRANTRAITAAKTIKTAYSIASFSSVTAATKLLGLSNNGFKKNGPKTNLRAVTF